MKRSIILFILLGTLSPVANAQDVIYRQGKSADGTPATWTLETQTDNAVLSLVLDPLGTHQGTAPDGYTRLVIRAQDEIRDASRLQVLSSSYIQGELRMQSNSFGFTTNPKVGNCRGTQCPNTFELLSGKNLRLTANGGGVIDVVAGNRSLLQFFPEGKIVMPYISKGANDTVYPGKKRFACFLDNGQLVSQPMPCDASVGSGVINR